MLRFVRSLSCMIYGLSYALRFIICRFNNSFDSHAIALRYNRQSSAQFIPFIIHIQQRYTCKIERLCQSNSNSNTSWKIKLHESSKMHKPSSMANDEQFIFVVFINQHPMATQIKWNRHVSHPHSILFRVHSKIE